MPPILSRLRRPALRVGWSLLGLLALVGRPAAAFAADTETRVFNILIDGKRAGQFTMTIARQADGTTQMTGEADTRITYVLYRYSYSYRGTELWKDGRLLSLASTSNDNGKKFAVTAVAQGTGLAVTVNGKERLTHSDVWLTTYWWLPRVSPAGQEIALLDADTGKDIAAKLHYVRAEQLNIGGQTQTCNHYQLTGGVQIDLWYDGEGRLVRQQWTEEGHRALLELTSLRRP
jgi:hypothetical protein